MSDATIPVLFFDQAQRYGDRPLFWVKRQDAYTPISWRQAGDAVEALSAFLLHLGINAGDRILLLSENRPEWGIADLAIQTIGAWTVPVYPSLTDKDISVIAADCEPAVCIVSTLDQAKKIRAVRSQANSIRCVLVMDPDRRELSAEQEWADALKQGKELFPRLREPFDHRLQALEPSHTASLLYTSGTTGEPKGVMLSHRNFLSNAAACLKSFPITDADVHLSFLPLSHVFERMAGWHLMLMAGASVAYAESMDTVAQNMTEVRPTIMLGVPRFFEKLHARVQEGIQHASPLKRSLAGWALGVGRSTMPYRLAHRPLPPLLRLQAAIADRLVFAKLRNRLGGRVRFFVSGSAPLSKSIAEFFYSAGITILEGYGLTETSPVIAANCLTAIKFGTVGRPIDGVEVNIAEDGEILTRGPHVMQGYYHKPQETAAAIVDGWFRTGDIGGLDADGFLSITDRKKDLIKTAGGKFVAPQKLENLFVTDPCIAQAFVYGDRERYCVALIVPNFQRTAGLAPARIKELVWSRVQVLQRDLPSFEQVKAIAVLDQEFTQGAGELTPTLKAKRAAIAAKYHDVLQQLYGVPAAA